MGCRPPPPGETALPFVTGHVSGDSTGIPATPASSRIRGSYRVFDVLLGVNLHCREPGAGIPLVDVGRAGVDVVHVVEPQCGPRRRMAAVHPASPRRSPAIASSCPRYGFVTTTHRAPHRRSRASSSSMKPLHVTSGGTSACTMHHAGRGLHLHRERQIREDLPEPRARGFIQIEPPPAPVVVDPEVKYLGVAGIEDELLVVAPARMDHACPSHSSAVADPGPRSTRSPTEKRRSAVGSNPISSRRERRWVNIPWMSPTTKSRPASLRG